MPSEVAQNMTDHKNFRRCRCKKPIGLGSVQDIISGEWFCSKECKISYTATDLEKFNGAPVEEKYYCASCHQLIVTDTPLRDPLENKYYHRSCADKMSFITTKKEQAGVKHDQGKLSYHLISTPALAGLAAVLRHGIQKYSERNWENGLDFSRCYRAVISHLTLWWEGEEIDQDSGLHHLDCAMAELMFLSHFTKLSGYEKFDNRPYRGRNLTKYYKNLPRVLKDGDGK